MQATKTISAYGTPANTPGSGSMPLALNVTVSGLDSTPVINWDLPPELLSHLAFIESGGAAGIELNDSNVTRWRVRVNDANPGGLSVLGTEFFDTQRNGFGGIPLGTTSFEMPSGFITSPGDHVLTVFLEGNRNSPSAFSRSRLELPYTLPNYAVTLTTGSPASLGQSVDTPTISFDLMFDYLFGTTTGTLSVILGGILLGDLSAPGLLDTEFMTASFLVGGSLLNQTALLLEFRLDGPSGSTITLDNIVFPGLVNGDFLDGTLAAWTATTSGNASVGIVNLTSVPEPTTILLLGLGLAGLGFSRRRLH